MAKKKHRKLFPILTSEANKTLDCSIGICDPICPYNCYPEPDYYAISPQQPPWSSPHPVTSPSPSIPVFYQEPQKPSSSSLDSITVILVTSAVLAILLTGFVLAAKIVSDGFHHERAQSERDENEEAVEEEEVQDHPVWLIRTVGLQQSIINSISVCNYKKGDGLIVRTDCPVCLSEFEEDERLRLLPKCNHAFHISCIDTWLRSHTNCPLCRAAISVVTPRCSGPVDVTSEGGSESRLENDGVGEDRGEVENGDGLVREMDQSGLKESSDVRIEIYGLEENHGEGSETETEDISQETEKENRHIGEEGSCSEEKDGQNVDSWRSSDSGESNGEATEDRETSQSSISLKTTGSFSV